MLMSFHIDEQIVFLDYSANAHSVAAKTIPESNGNIQLVMTTWADMYPV